MRPAPTVPGCPARPRLEALAIKPERWVSPLKDDLVATEAARTGWYHHCDAVHLPDFVI
jgi:hypothetical protein